jgi:STE24 endopeptidase
MAPDSARLFSLLFIAAVALSVALKLWLLMRQARHVAAHRDRVPGRFAERISLADHQKAADYTQAKIRLAIPSLAIETIVLLLLTLGGGLQWLHELASGVVDGNLYGLLLVGATLFLLSLADLPVSIWRQFVVEARFGFNRMTPRLFVADLAKQTALSIVLGAPLLYVVLFLMGSMGDRWWLFVWIVWAAFNLLMLWAYPAFIAPLFNKFTPLDNPTLRERIEALLDRCGFRSSGLFIMDGSKRSAHGNAYFTGLGRNKRIVFFDTLIDRLSPQEAEAVLAHELGHFHHRHVVKRVLVMFGAALVFLFVLAQLMNTGWFFAGLGVAQGNTALALLLFALALPPFLFPLSPLGSLLSRRHEYEADRYAARNASPDMLVSALVKLYQDNAATLTPDPVYSSFYDSHPPATLRIRALESPSPQATN